MKHEHFFVHVYFSHESVFPDKCDDWTNENVSFAAQNYECLFNSFVLETKLFIGPIATVVWEDCLVKNKHAQKNIHASRLNANGGIAYLIFLGYSFMDYNAIMKIGMHITVLKVSEHWQLKTKWFFVQHSI